MIGDLTTAATEVCSLQQGLPVTIRLLDPPLHEFLPDGDLDEIVALLASDTGADEKDVVERIEKLAEVNPMLGRAPCNMPATSFNT